MSNSKKFNPPPIVYISLFLLTAIGVYLRYSSFNNNNPSPTSSSPPGSQTFNNNTNANSVTFPLPANVASGTAIAIDGSTSMAQINKALKDSFQKSYPGTQVVISANGSDRGITSLLSGNVDIAALSRSLTQEERSKGLTAVPISQDSIAIVVGTSNPFRTGLKREHIAQIFQGKITNWEAVGGKPGTIRVIDRPTISGTNKTFQEIVLNGQPFGTGANFTRLDRDATTPLLQALKADGISYATFAQIANQSTVRTVAIDGLTPEASNYPFQRTLYYVYKDPPSDSVKAFLGYITSPKGKESIPNLIPVK
jgi:phosphate transport system substrate-binding protein